MQDVFQAVVALVAQEVPWAQLAVQGQAIIEVLDQHRNVAGVGRAGPGEQREAVVRIRDDVDTVAEVKLVLALFLARFLATAGVGFAGFGTAAFAEAGLRGARVLRTCL